MFSRTRIRRGDKPSLEHQAVPRLKRKVDSPEAQVDAAGLLRRAAEQPNSLTAQDVLHLQQTLGNRGVARLLSRRANVQSHANSSPTQANGTVQRLLSDGYSKLYASKNWMDTKLDDRDETIRDILNNDEHRALRQELFDNIGAIADITVTQVSEVRPSTAALTTLKTDGFSLYDVGDADKIGSRPMRRLKFNTLKKALSQWLLDVNTVTVVPDKLLTQDISSFAKKLMLNPGTLVKAPDDLAAGFNIEYVCALIAIVKGEWADRSKLNAKLETPYPTTAEGYYRAFHEYYYTNQNIQYDEPSTHPQLFAEWGYTMIFAGNSTFKNLPKVLKQPLLPGKKYILDITGHSVYVTMKKPLRPGAPLGEGELIADYFTFNSDPSNFSYAEGQRNVENIYEK